MKRNNFVQAAAAFVALVIMCAPSVALKGQTRTRQGAAASPSAAQAWAAPLPASDAVLVADLRRLLTEAMPRVFEGDAERVAQVNADVDRFRQRTGIDARQFDTLAVGARITRPREGVTKVDHLVAVARGKFDAAALVAAGREASGGRLTEQKHGGKPVYVATINDRLKLFGLVNMRVSELAMAPLDSTTLAVGEPAAVRAAIDAQAGRGAVDKALLNTARPTGALVGFAGNIPAGTFSGIETGLPEVDKSLASIRRFHGSVGMTGTGYQLLTVLGTQNAQEAARLRGTIDAVRAVAPALISMAGERGRLAQGAIQNLKVTAQGPEVQMRLDLAQDELAAIMRAL